MKWVGTCSRGATRTSRARTVGCSSDQVGLDVPVAPQSWPFGGVSNIGLDQPFTTARVQLGSSDGPNPAEDLYIHDNWLPGFEEATVQVAGGEVVDLLAPNATGDQVVDLYTVNVGDAPPLLNPDATGPIDALFKGDTADWSNATTLFDDWLGIDRSCLRCNDNGRQASSPKPPAGPKSAVCPPRLGAALLSNLPGSDTSQPSAPSVSSRRQDVDRPTWDHGRHQAGSQKSLPADAPVHWADTDPAE